MLKDCWEWLRDEQNQGALKVVGASIAAVVLAGWAYFLWYDARPKPPPNPSPTETVTSFVVCHGEHQASCGIKHDVFLDCDHDIQQWEAATCKKNKDVLLKNDGGNRCGYTVVQVDCVRK